MNQSLRHLRVGYVIRHPYSNPCVECIPDNCECKSPGVQAEIVLTMLKILNFTFELVRAPGDSYGSCKMLQNKTLNCSGMFYLFQNNLIDTALLTFSILGNRHKTTENPLKFSFPVSYTDTFYLISRNSENDLKSFRFFTEKLNFPFVFVVVLSFVLKDFFIFIIQRKSKKFPDILRNFLITIWKGSLGMILCQYSGKFASDFTVSSFSHLPFQNLHEANLKMANGTVKELISSIPLPCKSNEDVQLQSCDL